MSIKYKRLGRHGVLVSELCLGTMNFGWHTNEKDSFAIMDRALDLGINFFDTADMYGWGGQNGDTELILGRWFAQGGGRRDSIILATKLYNPMNRNDTRSEPNRDGRNLSAVKIARHCDDSLKRLQTDVIDLYQMHHIDRDCPWDETWEAFDALKKQGKIIYTGSSNFAGWDIATACQEAAQRNMTGLVSEQSVYNLSNRTIELEVIPALSYYGMGLIPWSPLGGGLLAGKRKDGRRGSKDQQNNLKKHESQVNAYEALCKKIGKEPAVVGLAWLLHNPAVTAPIIGPRTIEQLETAMQATKLSLDKDILDHLDKIWPGPGGEAPQAYAW